MASAAEATPPFPFLRTHVEQRQRLGRLGLVGVGQHAVRLVDVIFRVFIFGPVGKAL